jgi:hypothetical protein
LPSTSSPPSLARACALPTTVPPTADLLEALADTFGPVPASATSTQADLARAAIALAAEDPPTAAAIDAILERTTPDSYPIAETIALVATVTAALSVLQTELTIERSAAGKYKVKLHKRAASDALLKALAQALMRAIGAGAGVGKGPLQLPK